MIVSPNAIKTIPVSVTKALIFYLRQLQSKKTYNLFLCPACFTDVHLQVPISLLFLVTRLLGLALGSYLDSSHQLVSPGAQPRLAGGPAQSSSSGIFFQGDGQSRGTVNSHLNSSFENSSNSIPRTVQSNLVPVSGDMNRGVLNITANSGPSVGASSLVTDANSAFSGGPHLQRNASFNTESYMCLPASPMSFSSNNISISGSSILDGSSVVQQTSLQDQSSQQVQHKQQLGGASMVTSQETSKRGQMSLTSGPHIPSLLNQAQNGLSQMQKKPRLDTRQEDILQQQFIKQLLQRQDSMQLQGHNPQLQALIQQQRQRQQQQQMLQSMPHLQQAQLQQQHQQHQQLRQQLQQQGMQQISSMKQTYDSGICARRLMKYMYHQRHRPPDNAIVYWRKFVAEYYAPGAKKRWCLSLYDNVGPHALGVFPQAAMDAWHCYICGSKAGRGLEATFEVLPRLSKIKFDSGVVDELLFLDLSREFRLPSGVMILEYGKAVQECVYEQLRVVHEGQLRIIFTPELKISSWEFCARKHEELLPRRLVAPQINQLVQVAQKYQSSVTESGSDGMSQKDLQTNCNMFLSAGRQLTKNLEFQSLNDLGFSKRLVRCLQIAEVVNRMKDLIKFSQEHNIGPIESLKNYPQQAKAAKIQMQKMQEMEQLARAQGLPTDHNNLSKLMAIHPGLSSHLNNNNNNNIGGNGVLNGSPRAVGALNNHQNFLRQTSMKPSSSEAQQEVSGSLNTSSQSQCSLPLQGPRALVPETFQNFQVDGLPNPHQQHQQLHNTNSLLRKNNPESSQGTQNIEQDMVQQLMQDIFSNSGDARDLCGFSGDSAIGGLSVRPAGPGAPGNRTGSGNSNAAAVNAVVGSAPNGSYSLKVASNNNAPRVDSSNSFSQKALDLPQHLQMPDLVRDITDEFTDNGFF